MVRFQTETIGVRDPQVARMISGLSPQSRMLARDETAFERLVSFHAHVHDAETPVEIANAEGNRLRFGQAVMSGMSLDGWLIGARHRSIEPGYEVSGDSRFAVATASVFTDEPVRWRTVPYEADRSGALEFTVEQAELQRPNLSLVDEADLSIQARAEAEMDRQEELERQRLNSIRVRVGSRVAWQLLRQNYVTEPFQSTDGLIRAVRDARSAGFAPQPVSLPLAHSQQGY